VQGNDAAMQLMAPPPGGSPAIAEHFARTPAAPADARRIVTNRFGGLLAQDTLDDVLLVVSELMTNAVRHGEGGVQLRLAFKKDCVMGMVTDEGSWSDLGPHDYDPARIGGHGLHIVGRVAERWGVGEDETNVWFHILAQQ
jgi:two-component sensor histidine kinase